MLYGVGASLLVLSGHGLEPWNVLNQGLARHSEIAIGTWSIIVSGGVLLLWIPLRERPGVGTIANAIMIGLVMNIVLGTFSAPHGQLARVDVHGARHTLDRRGDRRVHRRRARARGRATG